MKLILTLFYMCLYVLSFSQETTDSLVCLPKQQVIDVATKLNNAHVLNEKYKTLASEYKSYISEQDTLIKNYTSIITKKDEEITIYRNILNDYPVTDTNLVWYKNTKVNYILGVLTGGSLVYLSVRLFTK